MSRHTQESSFLSQMEPCAYSKDVVELGRQIVKELGLEPSVDTLGRWMAHHLAELLNRAENAPDEEKDAARRECSDLIVELWIHRASLPTNRRPWSHLTR